MVLRDLALGAFHVEWTDKLRYTIKAAQRCIP